MFINNKNYSNIFASYYQGEVNIENEFVSGFFSHINDRVSKTAEYLERCAITFIIRGAGKYSDNFIGNTNLKHGVLLIRPQGTIYNIERIGVGDDYLEYVINIPANYAEILYATNMLPRVTVCHEINMDNIFFQHCARLIDALKQVKNNYLGEYFLELIGFLDYIYNIISLRTDDKNTKLLQRACKILESNIDEEQDLVSVAKSLGISSRKMRYLFMEKLQISPKKYRMQYKFIYAKNLILNTDKTIKEIASLLGYSQQHNFSRQFKLLYNMSPEEYRYRVKV